jgi:hypothetical protein
MRWQRGILLLLLMGVFGNEMAFGGEFSLKEKSLSAVIDVPGGLGFEFTDYLGERRQLAITGSTWLFLTKGSANLRYYLRENNLHRRHRVFAGLGIGILWLPIVAVLSSESPLFPMVEPQFGYEYVANSGFTLRTQISSTIFIRTSNDLAILPIPTGSVRIGWSY